MAEKEPNSHEPRLDNVLKVVAVIFVCLLSFTVGTYAGKRYSDYQYRQASLATPKPSPMSEISHLDSELVTDQDLELARQLAEGEKISVNLTREKTDLDETVERSVASSTEERPSLPSNENQQEKIESSQIAKPQAQKASPTSSSSLPNEIDLSRKGKFTIQVGAFPTQEEAEKLVQTLEKKELPAFWSTAKVFDPKRGPNSYKTWYRVNVGLYENQKEAEDYKNQLLKEKVLSSAFVQRISED